MKRNLLLLACLILVLGLGALRPGSVGAQTPSITISPDRGASNETRVTVTGFDYPVDPPLVNILYDGVNVGSTNVGTGTWSVSFKAPRSSAGTHTITAGTATATFLVEPTARLDKTRGSHGTRVDVFGEGFSSSQSGISVSFNNEEVGSGTADGAGSFSLTFAVPLLPAGAYSVNIGGVTTRSFTVSSTFSINPDSGPPGTSVRVLGSGFDFNANVNVSLDGKLIQTVSADNSGQLATSIQIPQVAGGSRVLSATGLASGNAQASFRVTPTFTIDTPTAAPGTSVSVSGSGFGVNETGIVVRFDGTTVASGITADSQGTWSNSFQVPAAAAGDHRLRASGPLTSQSLVPEARLTIGAGITLDPTGGPAGTVVKVTGAGAAASERITVTVGNNLASTEVVANSQGLWSANITIPAAPRGPINIDATGRTTRLTSTGFSVASRISLSRRNGPPGTTVALVGEGFTANQSGISISFEGSVVTSATANPQGSWTASFTMPQAAGGTYQIKASGSGEELQVPFTVTSGIVLSKTGGGPGDSNTVTGSGFAPNERDINVTLGDTVLASGVSANSQGSWNVNFTVPDLPAGSYPVIAGGSMTSSASVQSETFTLGFQISISSTSGPPGTPVTVTGRGFGANQDSISVMYDEQPAVSDIVADGKGSFTATFMVPPSAGGRHSISVSGVNAGPATQDPLGFQVSSVIELAQATGSPGSSITIDGSGFRANERDIVISYDDQPYPTKVTADARGSFSVPVTIPPSPTGVHVISVAGPVTSSAPRPEQTFTVAPMVDINEAVGNVGMSVQVTGQGFEASGPITLTYDKVVAATGKADPSGRFKLEFEVPASEHGEHVLMVVDEIGNELETIFSVEDAPPEAPVLLGPENGNKGGLRGGFRPAPKWSDVEDPSGVNYTLVIARDPEFADVTLVKEGLPTPSYALSETEALDRGKYYWRVRAVDGASNVGPWSSAFVVQSGILPFWVVPMVVVVGLLASGSGAYAFFRYWQRSRQEAAVPEFVRITAPEPVTGQVLPSPAPAPALAQPARRALPSPFRRARTLSPEEQARLQMVTSFVRSLPLLEVSPDLGWIEDLVDEQGGSPDFLHGQILSGSQDLGYSPIWMQHPTYGELQNTEQAQPLLQGLDQYIRSVNECAEETISLFRVVHGDLTNSAPSEEVQEFHWRFALTTCQSAIAWFSGTHLGQPSARDYSINPVIDGPALEPLESEEEDEELVSLRINESLPFGGLLVENISEDSAAYYRDLHIQLRNIFRNNDGARLLSGKLGSTEALRQQLVQAISQLGQNA